MGYNESHPAKSTKPEELYRLATERAQAKDRHGAQAGSLDLGPRYSYYGSGPEGCRGQLRTAYVRLTVEDPRDAGAGRYYRSHPGRPKWTPVGVWCEECHVLWSKPADKAKAVAK